MSKLKFKEGAIGKIFDTNKIEAEYYYRQAWGMLEQFTSDELFEPMEIEPIVLEGVACDYKEIKSGDWFLWESQVYAFPSLKLKLNIGYTYFDGSYHTDKNLQNHGGVINFGKLDSIPEKFTIKIKEPENKAKQKEPAKVTYLVCKKCLKIIDVNGDSYHNEQHDSYTGEVSGNFFYSWTCPVCVEKEKKREAETCVHRSLA